MVETSSIKLIIIFIRTFELNYYFCSTQAMCIQIKCIWFHYKILIKESLFFFERWRLLIGISPPNIYLISHTNIKCYNLPPVSSTPNASIKHFANSDIPLRCKMTYLLHINYIPCENQWNWWLFGECNHSPNTACISYQAHNTTSQPLPKHSLHLGHTIPHNDNLLCILPISISKF